MLKGRYLYCDIILSTELAVKSHEKEKIQICFHWWKVAVHIVSVSTKCHVCLTVLSIISATLQFLSSERNRGPNCTNRECVICKTSSQIGMITK